MNEEKSRSETLDEIFQDDPTRKAREKEIEKLEKKRAKALAKAKKKASSENIPESNEEDGNDSIEANEVNDSIDSDASEDEAVDTKKKKKKKTKEKEDPKEINIVKDIISLGLYIVVIILLCWLILKYVGQRTEVDGESMSNTLHTEDSLWIDKISYRFNDPERFDIVVFPYDEDSDTFYIKRIIGLPGETVYIDEEGLVYINNELLEEDVYGREPIEPSKRGVAAEPVTLGEDEYFVMGDNRNNSRDSRLMDVGNIHKSEFIGKAVFRFKGGFGKIE